MHEHGIVRTVQEVEEMLPGFVDKMVKTIAFKKRDGRYVLVGLHGYDRIDYRKLALALGVNRRDIHSLSPQEVEADLGFEIGGVAPFALRDDITLLLDERLATFDTINCGSGTPTITIQMRFADLHRITGGILAFLCRE
ncbi:MAG: YbaK/EbsC family protein [Chloroflexi bacterium]|nr:YbaK/EbsC family protein [Chloroflexota bacterium]